MVCGPDLLCPQPFLLNAYQTPTPGSFVFLDGTFSSPDVVQWHFVIEQAPAGSAAAILESFFDIAQPAGGGFPDDVTTSRAVMHVDLPGRYLIKMVVLDNDGLWAPSPACPAHTYMVLDAGPVGPLVPQGDPCDRARAADRCELGLTCAQTFTDGAGICDRPWQPVVEVEPNHTTLTATPLTLGPAGAVAATLDECRNDAFDAFRLSLAAPSAVAVETTNAAGTCGADTRLFQVDGAILDGLGYEAAIDPANALAFNNDLGLGRCSHLEGLLPAGDHYFVVDNGDEPATYAVRVYPLRGLGDRCDVWGVEDRCAAGTTCVDANSDGDGVCQ